MRGKAGKHRGHVPASRITPAYAGKSPGDENRQDAARDHPRVCGEKKIANSDELAVEGSPPRMRGKVLKNRVKSGQPRITPAYAGKRSAAVPFVCCEFGSPPRMRGKATKTLKAISRHRITPAYAGKSSTKSCTKKLGKDHPRVCGEKVQAMRLLPARSGSPPRMRGKD